MRLGNCKDQGMFYMSVSKVMKKEEDWLSKSPKTCHECAIES